MENDETKNPQGDAETAFRLALSYEGRSHSIGGRTKALQVNNLIDDIMVCFHAFEEARGGADG